MDEVTRRNQALYYAMETHPLKFNVESKPEVEDLIERAEKFDKFLRGE